MLIVLGPAPILPHQDHRHKNAKERIKESVCIPHLTRREALKAVFVALGSTQSAAQPGRSTLIGTGAPGYSDPEVNNPYGVAIGPDGGMYFCDLDNQRIRRLDLSTHRTTTIAGNGQRKRHKRAQAARQPRRH